METMIQINLLSENGEPILEDDGSESYFEMSESNIKIIEEHAKEKGMSFEDFFKDLLIEYIESCKDKIKK